MYKGKTTQYVRHNSVTFMLPLICKVRPTLSMESTMPPKLKTNSGAVSQRSSRRGTNTGKTTHSCLVCQENIIDSDETNAGQDSIMCEGLCKGWLHRTCCGLTRESFEALKHSDGPFKCYQCQLEAQEMKISSLEAVVDVLQTELLQLKSTIGKTDNPPQAISV